MPSSSAHPRSYSPYIAPSIATILVRRSQHSDRNTAELVVCLDDRKNLVPVPSRHLEVE
jgi:hypothetical protein